MPTPRALDAVYRDRRPPLRPREARGEWGRLSATALTVLWAAYLGAIAPVAWMALATLRALADGPATAEPGVFGAAAVIASGFVVLAHLMATGLGVCVALVSLVIVHASGVAVRKLPFGIALAGAMLSVGLLEPPSGVATAAVQLLAMLGTAAWGVAGTWRVWKASRAHAMVTTG